MNVMTYAATGFEGELVSVETDIRRGIPGFEIVGLPDGAVRESRERVRVALKNRGFSYPLDRILVNLSPADVRKEGASFDLPIALSLLLASNQIAAEDDGPGDNILVLGELQLSGKVRGVRGVLPAVATGISHGIETFIVPRENILEARSVESGKVFGISTLSEAVSVLNKKYDESPEGKLNEPSAGSGEITGLEGDFAEIKGQPFLKRALEIAAAGNHHVFIFGPPGCGKTMAARRFPSILPALSKPESIAVSKIYSLAGRLPAGCNLILRPPFRSPHHSASMEGVIGGGRIVRPGEISLAHNGVLLLDEAPEFKKPLLQSLREPLEERRIVLARAGYSYWFPADFQLIMTANPCPCGNTGRDGGICLCNRQEIYRYWKRIGSALLDRIDIRIPLKQVEPKEILSPGGDSSQTIRGRVNTAVAAQRERYGSFRFSRNSRVPPGLLPRFCRISNEVQLVFAQAVKKLYLSSRACHSILKIARTIADLDGRRDISSTHLLEAIHHRRYGESDFFWNPPA